MRLLRMISMFALALAAAAPALAYTIVLKDGSRVQAKEKYVIRGKLAIITLPSGTESSLAASQIDVARTEDANRNKMGGTAMEIAGGRTKDFKPAAPPPQKQPRLEDLIRSKEAAIQIPVARPAGSPVTRAMDGGKKSSSSTHVMLPDSALAGTIRGLVTSRGMTAVEVYRGDSPTRPLLVYQTLSEGAVFKALVTAANALVQIQKQEPGKVDGFRILCETDNGSLGAKFRLTPEQAAGILSGRYEITRFFVDNVEF